MKEFLTRQIQFEHWANTELLANLKKAQPLNERAQLLFSHILSAATIWLGRINGIPSTATMWDERTLDQCEALIKQNTEQWLAYIDQASEEELNRIVEFIFFLDGSKRKIGVTDAIMHIVHHSSYHRGQIVTLLKGSIDPLPLVTYVVFAAEKTE